MQRRTLWLLLAYLLLRWVLATDPGYVADVQAYKRWAMGAAQAGVAEVYERSDMDYPPLYAYLLYPLGKLYQAVVQDDIDDGQIADSILLTVLVKIPPLLFDLAIAGLIVLWRRRHPEASSPDRWTRWLPWLYLLNPAVLWDTAYWGQPDSVHSAFLLAAFLWIVWARSAWPSWILLTLATLMKPLGAPFLPLLGVLSLVRHGFRSTLLGGLAGLGTAFLVLAPFLVTGRLGATLERMAGDVRLMAHTSSNAHNFWWAVGGWRDSNAPWLGPLTPTQVGVLLFGLFYAGLLWVGHRLHRREGGISSPQILGLAVLVSFGFFMFGTQLHENHLFAAIPLLLPLTIVRGRQRALRRLFLLFSLGVLLNLALHDVTPGKVDEPSLRFLTSGGPTGTWNHHLDRPFFLAELWAIRASLWLNLSIFGYLLVATFRRDGWLQSLEEAPPAEGTEPA